jgi:hypothetical protein
VMATEREIVEAKLRELYPRDDYMAVNGLGSEEYEEDTATGAEEILAALRESRKADAETVRTFVRDNGRSPGSRCSAADCTVCDREVAACIDTLAALSRLAGDE